MSLTDSPDYLFRPEDKAFRALFPSTEEAPHNSFDEFLDAQLFDLNHDDNEPTSPFLDEFFASDRHGSSVHNKAVTIPCDVTPQPWRRGLWCLNTKANTALVVEKTRKMARLPQKFVSPAHLVNDEQATTQPQRSTFRASTMTISASPRAANRNKDHYNRSSIIREQTLSPSPGYADCQLYGTGLATDGWQQDFQNIHLQLPDCVQRPADNNLRTRELVLRQTNAKIVARNATVAHSPQSPTKYHYPFNHVSRLESGYAEQTIGTSSTPKRSDGPSKSEIEQLYRATYADNESDHYIAPVWTTESLHSSDGSLQSHNSQYSSENFQQGYPNIQELAWMPSSASTNVPFLPQEITTMMAAPVPLRVPHQVLCQQERYQSGANTLCTDASEIGKALSYEAGQSHTSRHTLVTPPPAAGSAAFYPPLPPYSSHTFENESPFTTPRKQGYSLSRSPSPSVSPTHRSTARSSTQRSPTRPEYRHSRRKSIHKPGPIRDVSNHASHQRTRSTSRTPRTPKTPKTPSSASFGQIDFVNFTPRDSAKLMSDVAPSGSSKTRARREQEAKDKRKRLSEAALQAVRKAGGDVSVLEKAILV